ncbi:type II/IV secretion system protein [Candidatus Parcubacteria bacterium]|nr:type II/IV secretion system protein [Candidatus Parcubacteria bacterium]
MPIKFDDEKQNQRLEELHAKEEEDLAQMLSGKYGIQYADLSNVSIDTDALRLIPEDEAREAKMAGFNLLNKKIAVAIQTPNNQKAHNHMKELQNRGYIVEPFIVSTASLERAWSRYEDISFATQSKSGTLDVASDEIEKMIGSLHSLEEVKKTIEDVMQMKKAFRISRIVEIIVAAGISADASDIHVEPEDESVRLRFRLDGVLSDVIGFDYETYNLLLSRVKLLSKLKLNIKNSAQDGRFSVKIGEKEIEIRTSILPGNNGESIVMRLLDPDSISVPITELGVPEKLLKILLEEIAKPTGMILNTGPTGSGKTTALYAFLNKRKSPSIKIITIEDPIEYHLNGIVQTQVDKKKGYDFASGLRSSLRQDPDIIMVGEIRDKETAETAIHAALTGHIVFSTLHTNNAAGAFTRLIDLGINPKIITSALSAAIAQRLVRRVCQHCKKEVEVEGKELETIKKIYSNITDPDKPEFTGKIYKAEGCEKCNGTGYRGRIGVFEAIMTSKEIENVVQNNPSEREIAKVAKSQGIMTMAQDGVVKIIKGITTLEEVVRVIDLDLELEQIDEEENPSQNETGNQ